MVRIIDVLQLTDRHEAADILEFVTQKDRNWILLNQNTELSQDEEERVKDILEQRKNNIPLQYIVGKAYFMGLEFKVNKDVLIPQPDTEILVEQVLNTASGKEKILDLCTGSGCIAISLKKHLANCEITASDISEEALEVAKNNAELNNVKINLKKSNLFENFVEKFDIIVSNPPYIATTVIATLSKEVQNEPVLALDGGVDGLDFYRKIIVLSQKYLNENGKIFLEIGYDQAEQVKKLFIENKYKNIEIIKDYGGNDRVVKGEI